MEFRTVPIPTDNEDIIGIFHYLSDNQARLRKETESYPVQLSWKKDKFFCTWCEPEEVDDFMFRLGVRFREITKLTDETKGPYR